MSFPPKLASLPHFSLLYSPPFYLDDYSDGQWGYSSNGGGGFNNGGAGGNWRDGGRRNGAGSANGGYGRNGSSGGYHRQRVYGNSNDSYGGYV